MVQKNYHSYDHKVRCNGCNEFSNNNYDFSYVDIYYLN